MATITSESARPRVSRLAALPDPSFWILREEVADGFLLGAIDFRPSTGSELHLMESTDLITFASQHDDRISVVLLKRGKQGDQAAIQELFDRYQDRVLRAVRAQMGPRLMAAVDPEDVFGETMLRAFASLDRFELRDGDSILRWFRKIARHVILEQVKKTGIGQSGSAKRPLAIEDLAGETDSSPEIAIPGRVPTPSVIARGSELQAVIDQAVNQLAPNRRDVVLMKLYDECEWEFIAKKMNKSVGAVQMLLLRAKEDLNEILAKYLNP